MKRDYKWLNKRSERSVNSLHLWPENPRLDSSYNYLFFRDFVEGMIAIAVDKTDFLDLIKSIATRGFQPFDPIVVWKKESDGKLYVAEGNRRVTAVKLLLEPTKAPKAIKSSVMRFSKIANLELLKKIPVAIAPSFEDTIWYINQRHVPGSNQKRWSRENHLIWISSLYDKYDKDINIIREFTDATEGELNTAICTLKLKDRISELKDILSKEEYGEAMSKRFPISTLERFVTKDFVQESMGFHFVDSELEFSADNDSFLNSFAELIRRMVLPKTDFQRVDSRALNSLDDIRKILGELPNIQITGERKPLEPKEPEEKPEGVPTPIKPEPVKPIKNDPNRPYLVLSIYTLNSDDYRLNSLFVELRSLSLKKYPNIAAAAIRVFLDITIKLYIEEKDLEIDLRKSTKLLMGFIGLKEKIRFIKDNCKFNKESGVILHNLLNDDFHYSLSVLNGYIHGTKTYNINKEYINSFWDFLFPLFQEILDIREVE